MKKTILKMSKRKLIIKGKEIQLTPNQTYTLGRLANNVMNKSEELNYSKPYLSYIIRQLRKMGLNIVVMYGVGYRLEDEIYIEWGKNGKRNTKKSRKRYIKDT